MKDQPQVECGRGYDPALEPSNGGEDSEVQRAGLIIVIVRIRQRLGRLSGLPVFGSLHLTSFLYNLEIGKASDFCVETVQQMVNYSFTHNDTINLIRASHCRHDSSKDDRDNTYTSLLSDHELYLPGEEYLGAGVSRCRCLANRLGMDTRRNTPMWKKRSNSDVKDVIPRIHN